MSLHGDGIPTQAELQEYIHTYKSDLLRAKDQEKSKAFERSNNLATRLTLELILISSGLLTIIGGVITTRNTISNSGAQVLATASIIFLLISIGAGLVDIYFSAKFFENWGYHLHKQGRVIVDDTSKVYEDLVQLRTKLQESSDDRPTRSANWPNYLQVSTFLFGLVFLLAIVIARIFSS